MAKSPLRYYGGKASIAEWIISHMPTHRIYVELFGGGASVLLAKKPSEIEVYNDLSGDVVIFFRVLRDQCDALVSALRKTPYARDEMEYCRDCTGVHDPVELARRFFVTSWCGRGGWNGQRTRSTGFIRAKDKNRAREFADRIELLHGFAERLRHVSIDNRHWREMVAIYDTPQTVFYADPPYDPSARGDPTSGYEAGEMTLDDHRELLATLKQCTGMVILSGYRSELYNTMLDWPSYERKTHTVTQRATKEVLWTKIQTGQLTLI